MYAACRLRLTIALLAVSAVCWSSVPLRAESPLVVHEWGTFTVLQDETGEAIPGVNVNEESLPSFVHRLDYRIIPNSDELTPLRRLNAKALPQGYPGALVRMETPVIYIYPPSGSSTINVDVEVQFRGGWITEWFPKAEVEAPGFQPQGRSIGTLHRDRAGSIRWNNIVAGRPAHLPRTNEHVWVAPRVSNAATLTAPSGESEKYLFYRGVANLHAPLRVERDEQGGALAIYLDNRAEYLPKDEMNIRAVWLVDIRGDGTSAFRQFGPLACRAGGSAAPLVTTSAAFQANEYSTQSLPNLQESMREALIAEGLFEAEADAMLSTWKISYFNSPGLRVFFTLPRSWTDSVLPLRVSQQAEIQRVMVGRIELVTPAQRKLLRQIATGPIAASDWLWKQVKGRASGEGDVNTVYQALHKGTLRFSDYGIMVPEDYQAFIDLGRFREPLVLDELRRRPTTDLRRFADQYEMKFMDGVRVEASPRTTRAGRAAQAFRPAQD